MSKQNEFIPVTYWSHPAWSQTLVLEGDPEKNRPEAEKILTDFKSDPAALRCVGVAEITRRDLETMEELNP